MGTLIAIEGVDGAGKFTLSSRLTHAWEAAGVDAVRVGFPATGSRSTPTWPPRRWPVSTAISPPG